MSNNTEIPFMNIDDLTRDEKREIWMKRTGHTVRTLAAVIGVVPSVMSRYLRSPDIPAQHHAALVAYGVPAEVLPEPVRRTPGRNPITPVMASGAPS